MTKKIHQQYEQQLLNIELAVITLFEEHPELTDAQVDSAYEELSRRYRAEATGHEFRAGKLDGLRAEAHDALLLVTELLVGRPSSVPNLPTVSAEEMRQILNRLRSSVKTWTRQLGRQGYLKYISQFGLGSGLGELDD